MLTRLKVSGFKNLVDTDVHFGPFTCIAGPNGVGKSNLFDAIRFLALLADHTILEAAVSVRDERRDEQARARSAGNEFEELFQRSGDAVADTMRFDAEMIVPDTAVDDLGQEGKSKTTFLHYTLELKRPRSTDTLEPQASPVRVHTEELTYIPIKAFSKHVRFPCSRDWRTSAVHGACRSPLISTIEKEGKRIIRLHQDGTGGRTSLHAAERLPRTILSRASASESRTALCARREMASWILLQLEPTALRRPNGYRDQFHVGSDGGNLPATLHHLAIHNPRGLSAESVYCQVANRLSELIGGVDTVFVDDDPKREVLTLKLRDVVGTECPARALSDGTLRFLALTVMEMDVRHSGLLCLEEPENGIHPERVPAMLSLLQDICTDPDYAVDDDNPLRQVLVNTHAPAVVNLVPDDALLLARADAHAGVRFACLPGTWRTEHDSAPVVVTKGNLLAYLNPQGVARAAAADNQEDENYAPSQSRRRRPRVMDREDLAPLLPGAGLWVAED